MNQAEKPDSAAKKGISREERLEKLKKLVGARGDHAAKVLKMWLQQNQETSTRKRR